MLLALSIVSEQGAALGPTAYKVFDERGGSIGRIAGNDWVLPDAQNFVSSRHAIVTARGGVFYLEDKSSNGTFINSADQAVSRSDPQPLCDGDRLFIGDYEIIVQLIPSAPAEIGARTVVGSVPPAVVARTSKVWSPSARPVRSTAEVHLPNVALSTEHSNVACGSLEKTKCAAVELVVPRGLSSIVTSGAMVSTVQLTFAGTEVLPAASVARTAKAWSPLATGTFSGGRQE